MTHRCPKDGCTVQVSERMLACAPHWYSLPKAVRDSLWRTWDHGAGAGTPEHNAAIALAIEVMNR